MPTPVDVEGFEHQIRAANPTVTLNPALWDLFTDPNTLQSFVTGRRNQGKALRIDLNAVSQARLARNLTTAGQLVVASFWVRMVRQPTAATARVFHTQSDLVGLVGINTSGILVATFASGTGITNAVGPDVTDGLWHLVDVRFNTAPATHTVDMTVDGVAASGQGSAGGVAASNMTLWAAGTNTTTSDGAYEIDDIVISVTTGDYPIGAHSVFSCVPVDDNAASVYGVNVMEQGTGTDLSSSNKAWQYLDEWPAASPGVANAADTVTQAAISATSFVDCELADAPSWATSALWAVTAVVAHQSDGTAANNGTSRIVSSAAATLTDIYTGDMSETGGHYTRRLITAPAGGWLIDATHFNGIRFRAGFSSDVTPQPEWLAMMVQCATPDQAPTPKTLVARSRSRRLANQLASTPVWDQ